MMPLPHNRCCEHKSETGEPGARQIFADTHVVRDRVKSS
jgi:hypothetical protein